MAEKGNWEKDLGRGESSQGRIHWKDFCMCVGWKSLQNSSIRQEGVRTETR